jgi:hypothetical protein
MMHLLNRAPRGWFAGALLLLAPGLTAQQLNVALCGAASTTNTACQWTDVQTRLLATGRFAAVDIINVTAMTPTLAQLQAYDALLCWTNSTPQDTNAWGDVLANYVDGGGGVVVAVFANSSTTVNRNIGGRWQSGYMVVIDRSGNASGAGGTLGTVHVPGHPVMTGVTAFAGGSIGSRPAGTALEVGATLVAEWSDGKVLVAQGANPQRIDLGFYPPEASCTQSGWTVGGDLLMANALEFVAGGASYSPYGAGCAGTLGVPELRAMSSVRPTLGAAFGLTLDKIPFGAGVIAIGASNTMFGPFTIPYDLSVFGMPGCSLWADLVASAPVAGQPSASLPFGIPNNPALVGAEVYVQG